MTGTETFMCFLLTLLTVLFFVLAAYATRPTAEDVLKCVEVTNYTHDRCLWEISR